MDNFLLAIELVFESEGGEYTDDPVDSGGPTKWGLTINDMKAVGLPATVAQIQSLTKETAAPIYKKLYWDKLSLGQVNDQKLSALIMDQCVLRGVGHMANLLQTLCQVPVDGVVGPVTIHAINSQEPSNLALDILNHEVVGYAQIVIHSPKNIAFLVGWENRLVRLYNYIFRNP